MTQIHLEPGDLLACYGTSWQCHAIRVGTASPFGHQRLRFGPSHVAIACNWQGSPLWVESTTLCQHPCRIMRERIDGCQAHLPEERIVDYARAGGRVEVWRLSPIDRLSKLESNLLSTILLQHFVMTRVQYDVGGALLSGTRWLKYLRFMPGACLEQLFCSELVAKVLQRLGRANRENPTHFNPASLLRQLVAEGTYQFHREFKP